MRHISRVLFVVAALAVMFQSGWVCYSADSDVHAPQQGGQTTGEYDFLAAHGLTQETFSIWLKEHSVWRKTYTDELKDFTFIPQDYDPHRSTP